MKIAITGGAGYVGCRLSEQLLNRGHEVICIDWLKYGVQPILNILDRKEFHLHKMDICDPGVDKIIDQADAVIHLAGIVGYPACDREPDLAYRVNVEGTNRVIDASKDKPFIYASTGSVYGELGKTCDETCETNPISTYSVYKLAGERYLEGSDAVMLSAETAIGDNPNRVVEVMSMICAETDSRNDTSSLLSKEDSKEDLIKINKM